MNIVEPWSLELSLMLSSIDGKVVKGELRPCKGHEGWFVVPSEDVWGSQREFGMFSVLC